MRDEAKIIFTRRLSQCNRGELIVIMYDILFEHLETAKDAYGKHDDYEFCEGLRMAQQVLERLMADLDFKYEISNQLYALYVFCRNELAKAMYEHRLDKINSSEKILRRLYNSFEEAAKQDDSEPFMKNTQQVYVGMTYGRGMENENLVGNVSQRGFLV